MFIFGGGRGGDGGAFRRRLRVYSCSMLAVEKPELAASACGARLRRNARRLRRAPPRPAHPRTPPRARRSQRWSSPTR